MAETNAQYIPTVRPRRVLVIGGGPSGLVTLRNLLERGDFEEVQLVERRDDIGGVWYLDDESPAKRKDWPSPAYSGLIGNVLPEFLHDYLRVFAGPLLTAGNIRLNTEVLSVEELDGREGWHVRLRVWPTDGESYELDEKWDAVVVAVAFYDHPLFPETPGIDRLRETTLATHAQTWRGPQGYEDKRVLVIGNANSGNDIAAQLAPVARAVFQSIRRPNFPGFPSLLDTRIARVKPVAEYTIQDDGRTVAARLVDGTLIADLDCVIFATGYYPHPDFVHVRTGDENLKPLVNTADRHIPSLHRYTLYASNPSLAFVGTAMASYTPFTIADICSTWLALAWSVNGGIAYPTSLPELLAFEEARMEAVAAGRIEMAASTETGEASALVSYCVLGPFEETFASELRQEVVGARPELDAVLPVWNAERTSAREAMFVRKREALELAREREQDGKILG
ncbi:hypothetical protein C8F01DRAFT_1179514 [Mycena amicta]|nr:hypothetical protein C8F01DRAFT_1179514 [Mycena amicta]